MEKCMTNPKSKGYISAKDMARRAAYYKVLQAAKNGELTRKKEVCMQPMTIWQVKCLMWKRLFLVVCCVCIPLGHIIN